MHSYRQYMHTYNTCAKTNLHTCMNICTFLSLRHLLLLMLLACGLVSSHRTAKQDGWRARHCFARWWRTVTRCVCTWRSLSCARLARATGAASLLLLGLSITQFRLICGANASASRCCSAWLARSRALHLAQRHARVACQRCSARCWRQNRQISRTNVVVEDAPESVTRRK